MSPDINFNKYIFFFFSDPYIGLRVVLPFLEGRITGGQNANKGEFPHQVSLQWGVPPFQDVKHFCAGTIIDRSWILTAGHCVKAVPSFGSFVVKAGKYNITAKENTEQITVVNSSFVHEKYPG